MADIWLINGIPGSGKSSLARALAGQFPRAVHIEGDVLQQLIVSGSVPPGGTPQMEESRQIHLNVRNQCLLGRSFADAGFDVFIDYVIVNRARVREYWEHFRGCELRLVTLAPDVTTALKRDLERREKQVAAQWVHLREMMDVELGGLGLRMDSTDLTLEQTTEHVLARSSEAILQFTPGAEVP